MLRGWVLVAAGKNRAADQCTTPRPVTFAAVEVVIHGAVAVIVQVVAPFKRARVGILAERVEVTAEDHGVVCQIGLHAVMIPVAHALAVAFHRKWRIGRRYEITLQPFIREPIAVVVYRVAVFFGARVGAGIKRVKVAAENQRMPSGVAVEAVTVRIPQVFSRTQVGNRLWRDHHVNHAVAVVVQTVIQDFLCIRIDGRIIRSAVRREHERIVRSARLVAVVIAIAIALLLRPRRCRQEREAQYDGKKLAHR